MSSTTALADDLTTRFAAIDGVRAIFPQHAAAAALALVGARSTVDGRVRVADSGAAIVISARLATDRTVPARVVIAEALLAVAVVVGARPYELELEFAVVD